MAAVARPEGRSSHPQGTVVEIGTGLNTRFERLDNSTVRWFDLDGALTTIDGAFPVRSSRSMRVPIKWLLIWPSRPRCGTWAPA